MLLNWIILHFVIALNTLVSCLGPAPRTRFGLILSRKHATLLFVGGIYMLGSFSIRLLVMCTFSLFAYISQVANPDQSIMDFHAFSSGTYLVAQVIGCQTASCMLRTFLDLRSSFIIWLTACVPARFVLLCTSISTLRRLPLKLV